jgi:hypothetical protein
MCLLAAFERPIGWLVGWRFDRLDQLMQALVLGGPRPAGRRPCLVRPLPEVYR